MSDPKSVLWVAATLPEIAAVPDGSWSLVTGCGAATAALRLGTALARSKPSLVVGVGIAGAYAASGFSVGDVVAVASDEWCDLGSETPEGFLSLWDLGFDPGFSRDFHATIPSFLGHLPRARGATCSCCTGTLATAQARAAAGFQVESMEGAAWALACEEAGVEFCQIRAISNLAGPRDRDSWRIPQALENLRSALGSVPCET